MTTDHPQAITITVDGLLVADSVDAVETCSAQALAHGRPVRLFLRDVSNIDEHGRGLLGRLAAQGVRLSASGVYSSYVVSEIRRQQVQGANGRTAGATGKRRL